MNRKKASIKTVALLVALFAASWTCEVVLTPAGVANGYMIRSEGDQPSTEAVSHALGEFRIVAANLIWLNVVDRYHHEFMEQGGNWAKNVALLPYLKMLTWLDPHFIEAYDTASSILANTGKMNESEAFLKEGVAHNPNSSQLFYDLAVVQAWYHNDAKAALPYAKSAELYADADNKPRMHRFVETMEGDIKAGLPPVAWHASPKSGSATPVVR